MTARALGSAVLIEGEVALKYLKFAAKAGVHKLEYNGTAAHPELVGIFEAAHTALLSVSHVGHVDGPEVCVEQECEPTDLIGTAEAAGILKMSRRHVVRIGTSLDGSQLANGQWVFRRGAVEDYREARRDARQRRRSAA